MKAPNNNRFAFLRLSLRYYYLFVLYMLTSFGIAQIIVKGNSIIGNAVDSLLEGKSVYISDFLAPLLVLILLGFVFSYLKSLSGSNFSAKIQYSYKNMAADKLTKLQYSYLDSEGTGNLLNKLISDIHETDRFFSETLPDMVASAISVITITVFMLQLNWRLFFVVIFCYPTLLFASNYVSKKLQVLTKARRSQLDERTSIAYDSIQGIVVGRSYNLKNIFEEKINTVIQSIFKNEYQRTRISTVSWVLENIISWIPSIICYLVGLYEVMQGRISVGELLAFVILLNEIQPPLSEIPFMLNDIREISVSIMRLQDILSQPEEHSGDFAQTDLKDGEIISFEKVSFGYDSEKPIFKELSFSVKKGSQVALVGGSGQGKSTVFKILCGFYSIDEGTYCLNGENFTKWNLDAARELFSFVSQNVFLLPETIAANVSFGKPDATMEEIQEACRLANIHDFILSLSEGYETVVGERGVRLSGGERQRISIARAFLKNAPILLLDEPTSAVDVQTEEGIKEAISRISNGKTVLTIAHRLNTIEKADQILVFSEGKIIEEGTHQELMAQSGAYSLLYGAQEMENE